MRSYIQPPSTKKAWVVENLRVAILTGELEPGQRLLEMDLAARFNVSPTPVREAIRQLEAEGLVSSEPHRGVRVAEANVDETRELYLIRKALELVATELAMERSSKIPVTQLRKMMDEMEELLVQEKWSKLRELHLRFHTILYQAANAPNLQKLLNGIWVRLPWDRIESIPGRAPRILKEHREIVEAFAAGDRNQAVQAIENHLNNAMNAFLDYIERSQMVLERG